jgi:hypothetical protein
VTVVFVCDAVAAYHRPNLLLRVYAIFALSFRARFTDMSTAPLTPVAQPVNTTNVSSAYFFQHFHMVYPVVSRQVHVDLNRFNRVAEIVD